MYELGRVKVTIARDAAPRIVGYELSGHGDLFADLPDAVIEHPESGRFWFIGGHRLWRAPEEPRVTYQMDHPATAIDFDDALPSLTISGAPDTDGVVKCMTLRQHESLTVVEHILRNEGNGPVHTAPWAITQFRAGGVALLPAPLSVSDGDRLLPNRSMALWPYTDPSDPEVTIGRTGIRVGAGPGSSMFKVGQQNNRGWVAYRMGSELFVKWAPLHDDSHEYPDLGSSVECYRDDRFLELETLGPLRVLEPGHALHHREVWTMIHAVDDGFADLHGLDPVPQLVS